MKQLLTLALTLFTLARVVPQLQAQVTNDYLGWSLPGYIKERFEKSPFSKTHEFSYQINPHYLNGDFNGDGDPDAVFWGHDKKNALLIGVLSHEKEAGSWEYKAQIIVKGPFASLMDKRCGDYKDKGIGEYLTLVPKGLVKHDCGPGPISLEGDAFILDKFCTTKDDRFGYRFYYYENGKFLSYPLICE